MSIPVDAWTVVLATAERLGAAGHFHLATRGDFYLAVDTGPWGPALPHSPLATLSSRKL